MVGVPYETDVFLYRCNRFFLRYSGSMSLARPAIPDVHSLVLIAEEETSGGVVRDLPYV